jgi:hypothetical protein
MSAPEESIKPKPRYDEDEDVSRHAAATPEDCEEMERRNEWTLVDVEPTGNPILPVDCVFDGETEFPQSYYDKEKL